MCQLVKLLLRTRSAESALILQTEVLPHKFGFVGKSPDISPMKDTRKTAYFSVVVGQGLVSELQAPVQTLNVAATRRIWKTPPTNGNSIAARFPNLLSLCLGKCTIDEAYLPYFLTGLSKLTTLRLGCWPGLRWDQQNCPLAIRLTEAGLQYARTVPISTLSLHFCENIMSLEPLRGLPLTSLDLGHCRGLGDPSLDCLREMPLTRLSLRSWGENLTTEGLECLSGLPLKWLDLGECSGLNADSLECLVGMELTWLDLGYCDQLTDNAVACLQGMPLTHLNLENCPDVDEEGIELLKLMPLITLIVTRCRYMTTRGLSSMGFEYVAGQEKRLGSGCCFRKVGVEAV